MVHISKKVIEWFNERQDITTCGMQTQIDQLEQEKQMLLGQLGEQTDQTVIDAIRIRLDWLEHKLKQLKMIRGA